MLGYLPFKWFLNSFDKTKLSNMDHNLQGKVAFHKLFPEKAYRERKRKLGGKIGKSPNLFQFRNLPLKLFFWS